MNTDDAVTIDDVTTDDLMTTRRVLERLMLASDAIENRHAEKSLELGVKMAQTSGGTQKDRVEAMRLTKMVEASRSVSTTLARAKQFVESVLANNRERSAEEKVNAGSETPQPAEGPDPDLQV